MSVTQFIAIVRMRARMARNLFRKNGRVSAIILAVFIVIATCGSIGSFVFALGWGKFFLQKIEPFYTLYVWDVLIGAFLFAWSMAVLIELQRSEMMSLKNLLHLPISLSGAFFLNYTSSLLSITIILFLPALIGLCVASVLTFGTPAIVTFALLAAFVFMVTAVSYLIRGWLARLMENKRTRGTVIAVTTIFFVLIFQIPNIVNLSTIESRNKGPRERRMAHFEEVKNLKAQLDAGDITKEEYEESVTDAKAIFKQHEKELDAQRLASINKIGRIANLAVPLGWLPYGASAAAQGAVVVPWLLVGGMMLVGAGALAFSYRSTIRTYTGYHNSQYQEAARKQINKASSGSMIEKNLPLLNDAQSTIATMTLQSLLRAPESKMALMTPLIFICVFGSFVFTDLSDKIPPIGRTLIGIGALGMALMGLAQLLVNMFGFDRQGFRSFVLMPTSRKDILIGKNLGLLPFGAVLTWTLLVFVQVVIPMPWSHFVATMLHVPLVYFVYFIISNYTSIAAPIAMAVGTMKPASMKFSVLFVQFIAIILAPLAILPACIALGIEYAATTQFGVSGVPVYLLVTLIEIPIVLLFYRLMIGLQGSYLQEREQAILESIAKAAE